MFNQYRDMKKRTRPNIISMDKKTTSELHDNPIFKRLSQYIPETSEHDDLDEINKNNYNNNNNNNNNSRIEQRIIDQSMMSSPQTERNFSNVKKLERTTPIAMPRPMHLMSATTSRTPDTEQGNMYCDYSLQGRGDPNNSQTDDSSDEQLNEESIIQQRLTIFIKSIINSESIYMNKLKNLINFREFLKLNCTLNDLTQYDMQVLFGTVEQLYLIHEKFFNKLILINKKVILNGNKENREFILLIDCFDSFECMLHECLQVYLSFLNSYTKAMTILNKFEKQKNDFRLQNNARVLASANKRKSFIECEHAFNMLINDDNNDMSRIYSEDLLRRPLKLVEYLMSLKEECHKFIQHKNYTLVKYELNELNNRMRSLFENMELKQLKEEILSKIDKNVLPTKVRINNDVVELCEPSNERKLRHLILYGDCLVCCKVKKDKRQLKWYASLDKIRIYLADEKTDDLNSEQIKHLQDQVVNISGDLKRQQYEQQHQQPTFNTLMTKRAIVKLKKKLDEEKAKLTLKSSCFKLIIQTQHRTSITNGLLMSNLATSFNNLTNLSNISESPSPASVSSTSLSAMSSPIQSTHGLAQSKDEHYTFLFTSDYERLEWLEEINGAIYAYKTRKTSHTLTGSEVEIRLNKVQSQKNEESLKEDATSTYTGTLEMHIKHADGFTQPNKMYAAVEVKSFGSYLEVAKTACTQLTTKPIWDEKFELELQCVHSIRVILYVQINDKSQVIASQELTIDPLNLNSTKSMSIKLNNSLTLNLNMKFLSPKKTITRRRTRNKNDIFGNNLSELVKRENTTIPMILRDCVDVIESKGIFEVGIYRVSAVVSEVQKMKELYSKNPKQAQNELKYKTPHLAANLLKLYLRELPEPLFTAQLYPVFMNAISSPYENIRDDLICQTFNELPEANKATLMFILDHLNRIASNADKNMMNVQNLSTLFGPTLMKLNTPRDKLETDDMAKEIKESMQQASVLFYTLKLYADKRLLMQNDNDFNNNVASNQFIFNKYQASEASEFSSKSPKSPLLQTAL